MQGFGVGRTARPMKNQTKLLSALGLAAGVLFASWVFSANGANVVRVSIAGASDPAIKVVAAPTKLATLPSMPELADPGEPFATRTALGARKVAMVTCGAIRGIAVDDLGLPIQGKFRILAWPEDEGTVILTGNFEDEEGLFELRGVTAGKWNCRATAEGYLPAEINDLVAATDEADLSVRIVLSRRPHLAGTVVDPEGIPIPNATLHWRRSDRHSKEFVSESLAATERIGSFVLEDVEPGSYELVVSHDDWAASVPFHIEVAAGDIHSDLVLALTKGGTLSGEAFARDGSVASNRTIEIIPIDERHSLKQYQPFEILTDHNGRFLCEHLEAGTYGVDFAYESSSTHSAPGQRLTMADRINSHFIVFPEVIEGQVTEVSLNAPPESPTRLYGKVTHRGQPATGVSICIAKAGFLSDQVSAFAVEGDGTYSVTLREAGEQLIAVFDGIHELLTEWTVFVPSVREHELNITLPGGRIEGRCILPTGDRYYCCDVILESDDGSFGPVSSIRGGIRAQVATDGSFQFDYVQAGRYVIRSVHGHLCGSEVDYILKPRMGISLATDQVLTGVDLECVEPGELNATVFANGSPAEEASIHFRDGTGRWVAPNYPTYHGGSSALHVSRLAPGNYQVWATSGANLASRPVSVTVHAGSSAEVALELESGTEIQIHTSHAALDCRVSVRDGASREYANRISRRSVSEQLETSGFSSTLRTVGPLPSGEYTILATSRDGRTAQAIVTPNGEPTLQVNLDFE